MNDLEIAMERGVRMSKARCLLFNGWEVSAHTIKDNPYDRKARKKEHVLWHNEFYRTRKEAKKGVM